MKRGVKADNDTEVCMKTLIAILIILTSSTAHAATYVDNATSGCSNGSTRYNPATRSCGSGTDTIYMSVTDANLGVSAGTPRAPAYINIRSGTTYTLSSSVTITKDWTVWQKYSGDIGRPVFDTNWSTNKSFEWNGIWRIQASGVTIDGLEIRNGGHFPGAGSTPINDPGGYGIYVTGQNDGPYTEGTIKNCYIHHIGGSCVNLRYGSDDWLVENNTLEECNYSKLQTAAWHNWGAGVWISHNTSGVTIKGNTIFNQGGEGINLNAGSSDLIVEDNILFDCLRPSIYPSGLNDSVIRRNLVYGTGLYDSRGDQYEAGVAVSAENYGGSYRSNGDNVDVYQNYIAFVNRCMGIFPIQTGRTVTNTSFYNNTCIESKYSSFNVATDSRMGAGQVVKNNIFYQSTGSIYEGTPNGNKFDFDYNLWNTAPSSHYQGAHDDYSSINLSHYFAKDDGWTMGGTLDAIDFNLVEPAPLAIDRGTSDAYYTANINNADGSAPDRGANEYGGGDNPTDPAILLYTLDADGNDTGGASHNLSSVGGTPDHTGGQGVVIASESDAGYGGDIGSSWNVDKITVLAKVYPITLSSGETHPIVGRWDVSMGRNWALVTRYDSPYAQFRIGTSGGSANEIVDHTYPLSINTDYYLCAVLDGSGKTLSLWVFDRNGKSLGTDINQAVLSAETWNYSETELTIGYWLEAGVKSSVYTAHSHIKHVEIYSKLLNKATVAERIAELEGGATPASPSGLIILD